MAQKNNTLPIPRATIFDDSEGPDGAPATLDDTGLDAYHTDLSVTDQDLQEVKISNFQKKLFKNEMDSCDLYLRNLHRGFSAATTVKGIISLVGASLAVHTHRRQAMKDLSFEVEDRDNVVELDNLGRPIKRAT